MDNFDTQPSSSSSFSNVEIPEKIESSDKTLAVSDVNLQEPSKSLSLSSLSPKQKEMDEIEEGVSEPKSENQDEKEVENQSLFDELPPEMLMKILKCLNVKSLTVARLVSRKWNEMAREIIRSRNDVETKFLCEETEDEGFEIVQSSQGGSLENFIQYYEDSKDEPLYTRFLFNGINAFVFEYEDWINFTCAVGENIKSLRLGIDIDIQNAGDELVELANNLRNLLLNQLLNLHEFGLRLPYWFLDPETPTFPSLQLVHITTTSSNEEEAFQLAKLKVLYVEEDFFSHYTGIVTDLLLASVNLQRIEPFEINDSFSRIETFQFLQSLGKLGCVQNVFINLDYDFMSKIQWKTPLGFKLKKLELRVLLTDEDTHIWRQASVFISRLFESSKDTLTELRMDSIGFLPNLQIPKFNKLTKLTLTHEVEEEAQAFPSELNLNEFFPLLQNLELKVPWADFFPHDDESQNDSFLPSLKTLVISGRELTKEDVTRISQVCPKLKELTVSNLRCGGTWENFPEVGEAIWTHLTKLESLDLEMDLFSPTFGFPALNSTFTGFSREDCSRLHKLIESKRSDKNQGSQIKSESKIQFDAERKNPSILDLKDLRKLRVHCFGFAFEEPLRVGHLQLMSVIEEGAFKLMENLTYKITN